MLKKLHTLESESASSASTSASASLASSASSASSASAAKRPKVEDPIMTKLQQLKAMVQQGLITEKDYDETKSMLLHVFSTN
jgi:hypothetical protein